MTADFIFNLANPAALVGWIILAAGVVLNRPFLRDIVAGLVWPLGFAALYTVLVGVFFFKADGGLDTLAHVQQLFTFPWVALAGWVHYLAFDLFIGAMIARAVMEHSLSRWFLVVLLPLTFMFGPIGYCAFAVVRVAFAKKEITP